MPADRREIRKSYKKFCSFLKLFFFYFFLYGYKFYFIYHLVMKFQFNLFMVSLEHLIYCLIYCPNCNVYEKLKPFILYPVHTINDSSQFEFLFIEFDCYMYVYLHRTGIFIYEI